MDLQRVNAWDDAEARAAFLRCCGSSRWAERMTARRPFANLEQLFQTADEIWWELTPADWREAFAAHPRIGDREALRRKFATAEWSAKEQAGVAGADEEVLQGLAEGNRQYEARFGQQFIVCATGKSGVEMLDLLRQRLANDEAHEMREAASEQGKITRMRLEKL